MRDPAQQLQSLYLAGFELETFDQYPKAIGVSRGNCVVLMVPGPEGLQWLGIPGWKLNGKIAVLTSNDGAPVFQHKQQVLAATEERRRELAAFREELLEAMKSAG